MEEPERFEPPVVAVLSGGNIDPVLLLRVIQNGMISAGRYLSFRLRDRRPPGRTRPAARAARRRRGQRARRRALTHRRETAPRRGRGRACRWRPAARSIARHCSRPCATAGTRWSSADSDVTAAAGQVEDQDRRDDQQPPRTGPAARRLPPRAALARCGLAWCGLAWSDRPGPGAGLAESRHATGGTRSRRRRPRHSAARWRPWRAGRWPGLPLVRPGPHPAVEQRVQVHLIPLLDRADRFDRLDRRDGRSPLRLDLDGRAPHRRFRWCAGSPPAGGGRAAEGEEAVAGDRPGRGGDPGGVGEAAELERRLAPRQRRARRWRRPSADAAPSESANGPAATGPGAVASAPAVGEISPLGGASRYAGTGRGAVVVPPLIGHHPPACQSRGPDVVTGCRGAPARARWPRTGP